jgi:hypothetical protein
LFTEHFQEYQALWNGEGGEVYFYQSELPYEATSQSLWMAPHGRNGFASYKVSDSVTRHRALGLGVYAIWQFPGVTLGSAVEFPENRPGVSLKRMVTAEFMDHDAARNTWANLDGGGAIEHIFNGQGAPAGWLGRVGSFSNE